MPFALPTKKGGRSARSREMSHDIATANLVPIHLACLRKKTAFRASPTSPALFMLFQVPARLPTDSIRHDSPSVSEKRIYANEKKTFFPEKNFSARSTFIYYEQRIMQ
jgi:hypothetical protein